MAIEDHFKDNTVVSEGCDYRTRGTVMDSWHRIERVRQHAGAAIECCSSEQVGGLGVTQRNDDSGLGELVDSRKRVR